jgi:hypothetical protein
MERHSTAPILPSRRGTSWVRLPKAAYPDIRHHARLCHTLPWSTHISWDTSEGRKFYLFRGVMRARCYPFDMPKRNFHASNPKVCNTYFQITYQYIPMLSRYILVQTGIYPHILVHTMIYCISVCRTPWTMVIVHPYPYCIKEDHRNVPLEDCWYARPQLFFTCYLRPKDGRLPKN